MPPIPPESIVLSTRLWIAERLIRLQQATHALLCIRSLVDIGMVLQGQFFKSSLNGACARLGIHAQHRIVIVSCVHAQSTTHLFFLGKRCTVVIDVLTVKKVVGSKNSSTMSYWC